MTRDSIAFFSRLALVFALTEKRKQMTPVLQADTKYPLVLREYKCAKIQVTEKSPGLEWIPFRELSKMFKIHVPCT